LKKENVEFKQENVAFKQEIVALKQNNIVFQREGVISKEERSYLKQQVETISTELQEIKNENRKLIEKSNHIDMDASIEIDTATSEPPHKKFQKEANHIYDFKGKVSMACTLRQKSKLRKFQTLQNVSLINDGKVIIIKCNNENLEKTEFKIKDISDCYEQNEFQYLFDKFGLKDEKSLIVKLLNEVPYHLYENKFYRSQRYRLVFSLDLQNIKDIEVVIPDKFKVSIINNELMVEKLHQVMSYTFLFIENHEIKLRYKQKFDLQRLDSCIRRFATYAPGYAFVDECLFDLNI